MHKRELIIINNERKFTPLMGRDMLNKLNPNCQLVATYQINQISYNMKTKNRVKEFVATVHNTTVKFNFIDKRSMDYPTAALQMFRMTIALRKIQIMFDPVEQN